jgi:hypothetical protein
MKFLDLKYPVLPVWVVFRPGSLQTVVPIAARGAA